ncbi:MAG: (d)CMP kinase [Longimicrobiaceae bacterium]
MRENGIIVAIDGPAGSGKSSTARSAARALGYRHLDSGAFYRALTLAALRKKIPPERWGSISGECLDRLSVRATAEAGSYRMSIGDEDVSTAIRSAKVNAHASRMAAVPTVRAWLLGALRAAGEGGGLVSDGRDIGTVVFPHAELKVFLVCSPRERARRRLAERGVTEPGDDALAAEADRLLHRDRDDSTRAVAPLLCAPDAVTIDTGGLDFAVQVERVITLARERGA